MGNDHSSPPKFRHRLRDQLLDVSWDQWGAIRLSAANRASVPAHRILDGGAASRHSTLARLVTWGISPQWSSLPPASLARPHGQSGKVRRVGSLDRNGRWIWKIRSAMAGHQAPCGCMSTSHPNGSGGGSGFGESRSGVARWIGMVFKQDRVSEGSSAYGCMRLQQQVEWLLNDARTGYWQAP